MKKQAINGKKAEKEEYIQIYLLNLRNEQTNVRVIHLNIKRL